MLNKEEIIQRLIREDEKSTERNKDSVKLYGLQKEIAHVNEMVCPFNFSIFPLEIGDI